MDSVSQIALGAAVGEAVLGRKLGNKAILWGAVGGTIPDLDIITAPFLSEIDSLAFHRGISHSIFFAVVAGLLFGWLLHRLHSSNYYRNFIWGVLSLLVSCIPVSIVFFLFAEDDHRYYYSAAAVILAAMIYRFIEKRKGAEPLEKIDNPKIIQWQWMFLSLIHI